MIKKIIIFCVIGVILVLCGVAYFLVSVAVVVVDDNTVESDLIIQGDVIMPTKVSRPGCEKNNMCYVPHILSVTQGQKVTWVNEDSAFHSVTSGFYDAPTDLFDSGHLDPFESYTLSFDELGVQNYYCTLHPWMQGQIIVQ